MVAVCLCNNWHNISDLPECLIMTVKKVLSSVLLAGINSIDFMSQVVGLAHAFNVDYLKASTLHHSPKL